MLNKIQGWIHKKCREDFDRHDKNLRGDFEHQFLKVELLNQRIKQLATENSQKDSWVIDPEYVFSVGKSGQIMLDGVQITTPELKSLKSEVKALKEFKIWQIIQSTLRQKAIEKAVLTSTDLYSLKGNEQVLAGKMMVFNLDVIKTLVNAIDKAQIK